MIRLNASHGIPASYANRHGLITGPTGSGKTISLMRLTESFAKAGVPVFIADAKGDLGALARCTDARFINLQVPVWAMGADLLARSLELSDVQAGCLEVGFAYAESEGLPLDTLSHLRQLLAAMLVNREAISQDFGLIGAASVGAIQRALLKLDSPAFAAPAFDVETLLAPGRVSIMPTAQLLQSPRLYGALMLCLLRDLYRRLPEIGDVAKPRLVLILDEAHTLFADATPALLRQVESTVRLIRSKGVGVYFASQQPEDIPAVIRAQCATTIEHSRELGVGRATFRTLDNQGRPSSPVVIKPNLPSCRLGPLRLDEVIPHALRVIEAEEASSIDMSLEGYAFLAVAALIISALVLMISGAVAAWGVGGMIAVGVGLWLGRPRSA